MADYNYVAVTNIPSTFHTADLRAHFSSMVESGSFTCFHFRHRPEKANISVTGTTEKTDVKQRKRCCVVKVPKQNTSRLLQYNNNHWTDVNGEVWGDLCFTSVILLKTSGGDDNNKDAVLEEDLLHMPELIPPELMSKGNVGTPTLTFLDLIQRCLLPNNLIKKLQLKFPKTTAKRIYGNVTFDYGTAENEDDEIYKRTITVEKHSQSSARAAKATMHFSEIDVHASKTSSRQNCLEAKSDKIHEERQPYIEQTAEAAQIRDTSEALSFNEEYVIKPSENGKKKIVDLNPSETLASTCGNNKVASTISVSNSEEVSLQCDHESDEHSSSQTDSFKIPQSVSLRQKYPLKLTNRERKRKKKEDIQLTKKLMAEGIEERLIAIDRKYHNDEDAEEWDRHEASEDDPSNQERNKERLYEEEIEQPWEKGGPGVVFYTDAMFWQAKEGDFDEQTTDDLDVDFSAYEERGAGDKDIKDFLKIRQELRFRSGYDSTDRFSIGIGKRLQNASKQSSSSASSSHTKIDPSLPRIGAFECFSKGIGRKVMERQGWREGQGLGSSRPGITVALKGEGQKPHNKRGLGYTDEELVLFGSSILKKKKKRTKPEDCQISTVYDNPEDVDPKVPLLQRNEPTTLKHRKSHKDKFST